MKKTILLMLVLALSLAMAGLAQAATITVGHGAGFDFETIQAGIDVATDADTVLVLPGEYVITEPITFRGKAITVKSEAGRDQTTIRMGTPADTKRGSVVVFENDETSASVLEGFTIMGGRGCWLTDPFPAASESGGGGITCAATAPTIVACTVTKNRADNGGGIDCSYGASPTLIHCIISENSVPGSGGGVLCWDNSSITMTNCVVWRNSAPGTTMYVNGNGGGIFCGKESELTMTNCNISENSAGVNGGGVSCQSNSVLTMTHCTITSNTSRRWSAGIGSGHSSITLTNCVIAQNKAEVYCGGVETGFQDSFLSISNCTVAGNSAGQDGGGVYCWNGASLTVTNSIFSGNTAPNGREVYLQKSPSTLNVTYSNLAGGSTGVYVGGGSTLDWGEGNIDADPYFADPNNGDYHLKSQAGRWDPDSQTWVQENVTGPCIDTGDPMSPIGLESFPNGGFVNMGAYGSTPEASKSYFGEPICETIIAGDINGDCKVDWTDLEIMALHWTDNEPLSLP